MVSHGFEPSRTTACVYINKSTGVKAVAHVDDFLLTGGRVELKRLQKELQECFAVDVDIVGPASEEVQSASFSGSLVRWTDTGLEIEGDVGDEVKLKKLARYLQRYPRCILQHPWQEPTNQLTCYTDSDWGGCVKTRQSTSGGCAMKGEHLPLWGART